MSESYLRYIYEYLQNNLVRSDITSIMQNLDSILSGVNNTMNYLYEIRSLIILGVFLFIGFHFVQKRWFIS